MTYEPTKQLRFVKRPIGDNRTAMILQQLFAATGVYGITFSEWRDVPVEDEQEETK